MARDNQKSLGIIGYGHFGKFLAEKLSPHFELRVYSASGKENKWASGLEVTASCDFLVLSLPLAKHAEVCEQVRPYVRPETVIVDVCSVKEESGLIIKKHLPSQPLLSTHPLFGPESATESLKDHVLVLCSDATNAELIEPSKRFFESLDLKVIEMTSRAHDENMALVQGLTFFIARVLKDFNLHESALSTPSFQKLIALAELEMQHTPELFVTIQKGNPHTDQIRKKFIARAEELQALLEKEQIPE